MRIFIDEDTQAKVLISILKEVGYDILTSYEEVLNSSSDIDILKFAVSKNRILLTQNTIDFLQLHENSVVENHSGIIAIYHDSNKQKNMTYMDIANALDNLKKSTIKIEGEFIVLNQWQKS